MSVCDRILERFLHIERLADHHSTGIFSSGSQLIDDFLRNEARDEIYGSTWVLVPAPNSSEVVAFYRLVYPYELGADDSEALALPAVELAFLAVDSQYQGQGIGTKILRGLIDRIVQSLSEYSIELLLLVALSPKVRAWYLGRDLGFQVAESPADRMTLYLPVADMPALVASGFGSPEDVYSLPPFPWPPTPGRIVSFPIPVDVLEASIRNSYSIPDNYALDLEGNSDGAWRATEVLPDLTTARRFYGRVVVGGPLAPSASGYSIEYNQEPDLTLAQFALYETIRKDWAEKMRVAEAEERAKFFLMQDGDYPDLFPSLEVAPMNVAGNVKEEMREVWHALDDMLRQHGYSVSRRNVEGEKSELWARPRMF